jgi:hypothetical protein
MLNEKIEKVCYDRWLNGTHALPMKIEDLAYAVVYGVDTCEDHCLSRDYSGDDACQCIRSIFPNPAHQELYTYLREQLLIAELASAKK